MKKFFASLIAVMCLTAIAVPAKADPSFYFGVSSGPDSFYDGHYHDGPRHRPVRYAHPYYGPRDWWYSRPAPRPVYYGAPFVVIRPQPVVYQTTYVTPPAPVTLVATPTSADYIDSVGRQCREYQSTASVGGAPSLVYGTACLQPDGSWRVVN